MNTEVCAYKRGGYDKLRPAAVTPLSKKECKPRKKKKVLRVRQQGGFKRAEYCV